MALTSVLLVYACGSDDGSKRGRDASAGSPGSEAGAGGADANGSGGENNAGGTSAPDLGGASNGGADNGGADNAGADNGGADNGGSGDGGSAAGAGGEGGQALETCNDTCAEGACVFDECLGTTTVDGLVNLSTTPTTEERECAEGVSFAVTGLSESGATLSTAATDCLAAGDEVLLINLQGAPDATANVGVWELLKIAAVDGNALTFASPKARSYGSAASSDDAIGTGAGQQRVAVVRVPRFGVLDIAAGGSITANPWDGQVGGVVALRAGKLTLAGKIDAATLGYRGGRFSQDSSDCSDSIVTEAGESIAGLGTQTTSASFGASGGLGAGSGSYNANSPIMGSPGHATAGEAGENFGPRAANEPGGTYGTSDGSALTLGSGPGGGVTCNLDAHDPVLVSFGDEQAGGIVLVLADELSITETGSISASPPDAVRDISFAGGYVLIRGTTLTLGSGRVTALGSVGKGVNGSTLGHSNQAGAGYITLDAKTVTGTTLPVATFLQ